MLTLPSPSSELTFYALFSINIFFCFGWLVGWLVVVFLEAGTSYLALAFLELRRPGLQLTETPLLLPPEYQDLHTPLILNNGSCS